MTIAARRIVSLLPGATEWVCELGLEDRLVGISHQCDYPDSVTTLPRVTRSRIQTSASSRQIDELVREHSASRTPLYELDAATLCKLKPDLILTQSLCNVCAVPVDQVDACMRELDAPCRLLDLRAQTFEQVIEDADAIVEATGRLVDSVAAQKRLRARVDRVREQHAGDTEPRVTLLEWADPIYCSGHWTPQLIEWAGGFDPIGKAGRPSQVITFERIVDADPDLLLLAFCGLDAHRTRQEMETLERIPGWTDLACVRSRQVHVFDGSALFNRPGPRLVDALECVSRLLEDWRITHRHTVEGRH